MCATPPRTLAATRFGRQPVRLTRAGQEGAAGGGGGGGPSRTLQLFSPGLAAQRRVFARAVLAAARSAAVLDLGCGDGTLLCGALGDEHIRSSAAWLSKACLPHDSDAHAQRYAFAPSSAEALSDPRLAVSAAIGVDIVDASLVRTDEDHYRGGFSPLESPVLSRRTRPFSLLQPISRLCFETAEESRNAAHAAYRQRALQSHRCLP